MSSDNRSARHFRALAASLWPYFCFLLLALAVMTVSRLFLVSSYSSQMTGVASMADVMERGWRFDMVVICGVCLVAMLVQWLAPGSFLLSRVWQRVLVAWLVTWLMLIVWNEAATPDFIAEFGVRPNRLFVEYLNTPIEIFLTIWAAHRGALLIGIALVVITGFLAVRLMRTRVEHALPWPLRLVILAPLCVALFYGMRGSTGHRPLGISYAAISTDPLINTLPLNSTYSVLHAVDQMISEDKEVQAYSHLPEDEVLRRVRAGMQVPAEAFRDPLRPMTHTLIPTGPVGKKPNLVILLQESLGARYIASLGGLPVAQKIESWRSRSLWFDQLYATGTRSARGIEAITAGFLPTRTSSVIKLEGAQHDFFTLAKALKAQGYRTGFIYGGDSGFDNMRRFFLGNGFDEVLDWSDLSPTAQFMTTWGVSDEDLYARVHQEVSRYAQDGQPFFLLVFSTSNHPPYDFPDGRIPLYEEPKMTANNAARYADFAVGSYLETAAQSAYWANSLFMVVADHESRVSGEGIVPIFSFRIPAFIAGGPVQPQVVTRLASQIDLLPTALSMMGVKADIPATGTDQTRKDLVGPGLAIMQFNDTAAYRVGDEVVILAPGQAPSQFRVNDQTLVPVAVDTELVRDAQATTQLPVIAYKRGWYR